MLLPKTLQSLQSTKVETIKDTLFVALQDGGVSVALLDLVFGHYFIYAILGDGLLMPVFVYEGCISYKQSQVSGLPKLHFCYCHEIAQDFSLEHIKDTLHSRHYLAKVSKKNAFSFSIKQVQH